MTHRAWDAAFAVTLVVALSIVYVIDFVREPTTPPVATTLSEVKHPPKSLLRPLRIAVTPASFDDMGKLLKVLGKGYRYDEIQLDDLLDVKKMAEYDVVFLTCGGDPKHWLGDKVGQGPRNTTIRMLRPEIGKRLRNSLRTFVDQGGTLYASDWRFLIVRVAFSELVDEGRVLEGAVQELDAVVVEPGLQDLIGKQIHLRFDLPGWYPAAIKHDDMTTYIRGNYKTKQGRQVESPLLVKCAFGKGSIFFTSFHNEKQNSKVELALLKYLVFATVTARAQAEVADSMVKGGFSPQRNNLLSTSSQSSTVTKTYQCTAAGRLQFVLAFENRGAKLRFRVESPTGKISEKANDSTITIDVENAQVGSWKYTVIAEKVPYENFPFSVSVWRK